MSFITEVESQIAANELHPCYMKAELTAVLQICSTMNFMSEGIHLTVETENTNTAKRVFRFLKELYQVGTQLSAVKRMKLKKNNTCVIRIESKAMEVLCDLKIMTKRGLQNHSSSKMIRKEYCIRAYLVGTFLARGSVSSSSRSNYCLEISTQNVGSAKFIWKPMQRFGLPAKQIRRRNQEVVHLKVNDKISDFLHCMGVGDAVFTLEDSRIQRDFMDSLTRLDNCELANEMKSIIAGEEQLEDIQQIGTYRTLDSLSEKFRRVACTRKQLPGANLNELCEYCAEEFNETISKPGMKHHLARLWELADQYRKK